MRVPTVPRTVMHAASSTNNASSAYDCIFGTVDSAPTGEVPVTGHSPGLWHASVSSSLQVSDCSVRVGPCRNTHQQHVSSVSGLRPSLAQALPGLAGGCCAVSPSSPVHLQLDQLLQARR